MTLVFLLIWRIGLGRLRDEVVRIRDKYLQKE